MNGFAAWAQSPQGTAALTGCALVFGMILGYLTGRAMGRNRGYEEAFEDIARERAMARRTRPVYRRRPPEVAHEREPVHPEPGPAPLIGGMMTAALREWEPVHTGQALAAASSSGSHQPGVGAEESCSRLAAPGQALAYAFPPWSLLHAQPPTFEEEIQAMIANANAEPSVRWLDQLFG